ncbi:MAG: flagellar filament capping protein FliD [Thiobacillaceae bacterium]
MPITSSSSTAIDVPTLVSQLMAVERRPIDTLTAKITSYETKISSYGTLSSLVSSFQSATKGLGTGLQALATTPSDPSLFSATVGSTSVPGTYSVNVSQLAQSQNLVATGQTSSTTAIGSGTATTVTFTLGAISFDPLSGGSLTNGVYSGAGFTPGTTTPISLTIDSTNNTLEGIRDAINTAAAGVTATIVNDGSGTPYRLALASTSSGVSNGFSITVSGDSALSSLLSHDPAGTQNMNQTLAAQNANLTVNGIPIVSTANAVSEAIQGVTLTLKNLTTTPATVAVTRDSTAINAAAAGFVDAYNALTSQIKSRSAYGVDGKGAGALAGDGTLRLLQEQMRSVFNTPVTGGTLTSLGQVGISFQRDGTLKLDSSKLNSAVAANFSDVAHLFSSPTGYVTRLDAWANSALAAGGPIDTRKQSLNNYVKDQNSAVDRLEIRMTALQKKYTTEYTNLNLLLSSMNSTSTFLTNQLASSQSK